jgi:hypothetical protein
VNGAPQRYKSGDRITFLPAAGMFPPMTILDVKDCETDYARPEPHSQYKVIDPEGNEDWICGYDAAGAR